ncbi:hypothetical protein GYA28_04400 [Candidatus Roizmanbacteria bacterium]|jgi:hypothetical protein|nr:hypothetical protein [Candidatus Roizmanbacteria bacterium]
MKKNPVVFIVIGVVVLSLVVFLITRNKKNGNNTTVEATPTEMLIPTVDSSVKASLESLSGNKEVMLKMSGLPKGTSSVDYELSYQTAQQGLQGVIGTVTVEEGNSEYEKKLTLGTCSSGSCVYHQVVGKIKLTLKFNGDYGEKIFEKEF